MPLVALKRATQLMVELAGGSALKGVIDNFPGMKEQAKIIFPLGDVKRLLGIELERKQIIGTLESLGFVYEQPADQSYIEVVPPWWRTDVSCPADLVEEIARIIGYDTIPATMLGSPLPKYEPNPMLRLKENIRDIMVGCGFQEILTYSLTSLEVLNKLAPGSSFLEPIPMKVANPMSREWEYLRTSLRPGLLTTLARNMRFREGSIKLFELGRVFFSRDGDLPEEREMLCAVLGGDRSRSFWRGETEVLDFFVAKGVVETLLSRLNLNVSFEKGSDHSLIEGRCAWIVAGKERLGVVGELHPKVAEAFELSEATYLFELELSRLLSVISGHKVKYRPLPRYPSASRDIALVVDEQITYEQVYSIISQFPLVVSVSLFDLYVGEQIPRGKKSLAFRIVFQSPDRTLTDKEIDKLQQDILARLSQELGAALRS